MTQKRRVAPVRACRQQQFSPAVSRRQRQRQRQPCYFFKIILPSTIQEKKMMIPVMFVRKFGDELSGILTLNGPDGRSWQVGLEKVENNIWFHNGWNEFIEFYSIQNFYMLLFRYVGKLNLDVIIFDMTACEIFYPSNGDILDNNDEGLEDNDSVEILQSTIPEAKGKHKFHAKVKKEEGVVNTKNYSSSTKRPSIVQEKELAVYASKMFKPENPSFTAIIQPYNLHNHVMYVPRQFYKERMITKQGSYDLKLQISDGRFWNVRLVGGRNSILSKGWSVFAKDNKLSKGDVCVFEKIETEDVMKVSIFRVREDAKSL